MQTAEQQDPNHPLSGSLSNTRVGEGGGRKIQLSNLGIRKCPFKKIPALSPKQINRKHDNL